MTQDRFAGLYSEVARSAQPSAIREICHLLDRPEMKSLAGGWPEASVFPNDDVAALAAEVLAREPSRALQYGPTEGIRPLRERMALWAREVEGIADASLENLLILHGSQQGMDLLSRVFIEKGDVVLCESPTYFGATGAIRAAGGEIVGVPLDEEGLNIEALAATHARLVAQGKRVKAVYIIPNFQNPSGVTLSLPRRKRLLELAETLDFLIFEDDPYGDLRYEGQRLPSLAALDAYGRVVHIHSLSKIFCPGLRLAWLHAESGIARKLAVAKQFVDACTGTLSQYLALAYIERGLLAKRIEENKRFYKPKRDFMLDALARHFPASVHYNRPQGGYFLFLTLPEGLTAEALLKSAMAQNVVFVCGAPFFPNGGGERTLRLSFSQAPVGDIDSAVAILGRLVHDAQEPRGAAC